MVTQKVQLKETDLEFIEKACSVLQYRSKSEYMRAAIVEKIQADKARLRELERQRAMEAYGRAPLDEVFEPMAAEDFEDR